MTHFTAPNGKQVIYDHDHDHDDHKSEPVELMVALNLNTCANEGLPTRI